MDAYTSHAENALQIARSRGIARARDFRAAGIPAVYLDRLCKQGQLVRLARGLYQLPEKSGTDVAHNLAEAARLLPNGVISLLSALRHHGLTTQLPHAIWITLSHKSRAPIAPPFPLEIIRATGSAFSAGIEHDEIEGVSVPIYSVAKTVADCFKHRRRIGLDIAVEALRDALRQRKATPANLWRYATMNRVTNTMRPYLEALT